MNRPAALLAALSCACACSDAPVQEIPPHSGGAPDGSARSAEETVPTQSASELKFTTQTGWIEESPSSPMRKAQYRLPMVAGDPEDAGLVVYYFGGGGGSVEANIDRWASEFEQADGSDSKQAMQRRTYHVNSLGVEEIALSGTFVAETEPGSGQRVHKPDFAVRAAIISSDHGPYYVKLTGPAQTVEHWEKSFRSFIAGVQP